MAGKKVAGSKLSKDRQAQLLALADSMGDSKAAQKYGVSRATVGNYRRALASDQQLCDLYQAAKSKQKAIDERVVQAESRALLAVWAAVERSAEKLGVDKPATPDHLKALAELIRAAGENVMSRADIELVQSQLNKATRRERQPATTTAPEPPAPPYQTPAPGPAPKAPPPRAPQPQAVQAQLAC